MSNAALAPEVLDRLLDVAAVDDDPLIGAEVAGWRLERLIGEGAASRVYRGRAAERRVAIKLEPLRPRPSERAARDDELAAALSALDHPRIVRAESSGEVTLDGAAWRYQTMPLVRGRTLASAWPDLSLQASIAILAEIAAIAGAAHAAGIVHRDITPHNVLLDAESRPLLSDFGSARLLGAQDASSGESQGTPRFMAPEQVRGDRAAIGPPSDSWAIGVMLYQRLTGCSPFPGRSAVEVQLAILRERPLPPQRLAPDAPAGLLAICRKALSERPADRYPDGATLAADLRRWLAGQPVDAARGPRRGLLLAAGALLIGALIAQAVSQRSPASRPAPASGAPTSPGPVSSQAGPAPLELAAVEAHLERARGLFYVESCDIASELRRTRALLGQLEREPLPKGEDSRARAQAERARATLLGSGYALVGEHDLAERYLTRADQLAHGEDEWISFLLGRLYRDRAVLALVEEAILRDVDPAGEDRWTRTTRDLLLRSVYGWGTPRAVDRNLAACYLALARDSGGVRERCLRGLSRHGKTRGAEEYHLLLALVSDGPTRAPHLDRAIAHRPHFAAALLLRAATHRAAGREPLATADLRAALAAHPRLASALQLLTRDGAAD